MSIKGRVVGISRSRPNQIFLDLRTEDKKKIKGIEVTEFQPRFYVRGFGKYRNPEGERVKEIKYRDYSTTRKLRKQFGDTWQSDIPFVRVFMVKSGIRSGAEIPDGKDKVKFDEIKPYEPKVKPRICYIDIEVLPVEGHDPLDYKKAECPIVAVALYDNYIQKEIVLILNKNERKKEGNVIHLKTEEELLTMLRKIFEKFDFDLVNAWNVTYDVEYLNNRLNNKGMGFRIKQERFDVMEGYDQIVDPPWGKSLDDALIGEELRTDVMDTMEVLRKYEEENDIDTLIEYVRDQDLKGMIEIDEKYNITNFYINFKDYIGLARYTKVFTKAVPIETKIMRMPGNIVLPNIPSDEVFKQRRGKRGALKKKAKAKGEVIGAIVEKPPRGIFENVAVFDWAQYYPRIMLSFNLSPEVEEGADELGILPRLCKMLLEEIMEYDERKKECSPDSDEWKSLDLRQYVLKTVSRSVYGYAGYFRSRVYRDDIMLRVAEIGREGIKKMEEVCDDLDYQWLAADTDGISVIVPIDETENLRQKMESEVERYFREDDSFNLRSYEMALDFEKYYDRIIYPGVKKRYAAHVIMKDEEPCDKFEIKHYEAIKSDQSKYTRKIQMGLIKKILRGKSNEEIKRYVSKALKDIKKQKPEDLAFRKGIGKKLDKYKQRDVHVKGALISNAYLGTNFGKGSKPKFLYVNDVKGLPKVDVIAFEGNAPECEIDWKKVKKTQVTDKIKDLLDLVGMDMKDIEIEAEGQKRLDFL